MKKVLLFFLLSFALFPAMAAHIKGGFFNYKYLGAGINDPSKLRYEVTLTVYMKCDGLTDAQVSNPINFSLFSGASGAYLQNISVGLTERYPLSKINDEPCIEGDQTGCYYTIIVYKLPSVELAPTPGGYIFSYQRCCRIPDIVNLVNSEEVGNTWSIAIPGTNAPHNAQTNSSPRFKINDTEVICGGSFFSYSFSAEDDNTGDSLSYYFCNAWTGGGTGSTGSGPNSAAPDPAAAPNSVNPVQYPSVTYAAGFSGNSPLGSGVTIDPKTGLISGIAPANNSGQPVEYVVTVCVDEFRQGVKIGTSRKELHVRVGNCNPVQATPRGKFSGLETVVTNCDSLTTFFVNKTPNALIQTHHWDFGAPGAPNNTSTLPDPSFQFPDTGTYTVKLVVNRGLGCPDSSTITVRVYPGFYPDFNFQGICTNKPTQFTDASRTNYGFVNSWKWDFGDAGSTTDISSVKNPVYTYNSNGIKPVRLIVTSDKGCLDTVYKDVPIIDKPQIDFKFRDTLICNGDTLQLHGIGSGNFSWTPSAKMFNPNTADPTVFPSVTTVYTATLDDNGCINTDTVRVQVVNFVTLIGKPDTTICLTDSVQLGAKFTNGLRFHWEPAADFTDPDVLNAVAHPSGTTSYTLLARIGHCIETATTQVITVPYPLVNAGLDTMICYKGNAFLQGSTTGNSFSWSPSNTLSGAGTLSPVADPLATTSYVLTARHTTSGCPKPVTDTVKVTVLPRIFPFAGRDTAVIVNQALQFNATGGTSYQWTPATALSNPNIPNPVAVYNGSFDNIRYKVLIYNAAGCVDSAYVGVKIFKTPAQVFVPTAFTPNRDGLNDVVRPIAVGITRIKYFEIYNRWGQKVFHTTINGQGWDGRINGRDQGTGVYVWLVKAVDYTGKEFFAKGTLTLIR